MSDYYFSGIGGIGMSSLAQIVKNRGHNVSGSDRNYNRNPNASIFRKLDGMGIKLVPQNGSGVTPELKSVIVSSAIEGDNPDVSAAKNINIPVVTRAKLLAELFNAGYGIAVGGSNGKTSITAMVGWILDCAGVDPSIMVGGFMKNYENEICPGNSRSGKSDILVIEADESDGTIVNYKPTISVLSSISKDHKTIEELTELFQQFIDNTKGKLIVNGDCPKVKALTANMKNCMSYGVKSKADIFAQDIKIKRWGSEFSIEKQRYRLNIPGEFNISNALAAISVAKCLEIPEKTIVKALETFESVRWRMDHVGAAGKVQVINDYAHNPAKIEAAIETLRFDDEKLIAIFQPHGFGPTKFLKNELIEAFESRLTDNDMLIMPEIYYAGGTVNSDISSKDIVDALKERGINALFFNERTEIIDYLKNRAFSYNKILVMGARDSTLMDFSIEILTQLKNCEKS